MNPIPCSSNGDIILNIRPEPGIACIRFPGRWYKRPIRIPQGSFYLPVREFLPDVQKKAFTRRSLFAKFLNTLKVVYTSIVIIIPRPIPVVDKESDVIASMIDKFSKWSSGLLRDAQPIYLSLPDTRVDGLKCISCSWAVCVGMIKPCSGLRKRIYIWGGRSIVAIAPDVVGPETINSNQQH
jgi:hypothetical protein